MPNRIPTHKPAVPETSRHRDYDRFARDRASRLFYSGARWRKLRALKLHRDPLCEDCLSRGILTPATIAHHAVELRDDPARGLDLDNLRSLCPPCHSQLHASNEST